MSAIRGIEYMTGAEISAELESGAKFVVYQYCISILVLTFLRPTDIYFVRAGESGAMRGIQFTLLTIMFGWWGIPWGPIYSIMALVNNLGGGKDVTREVLMAFSQAAQAPAPVDPNNPYQART